jgi:hypothetical protein
MWGSVRDFKDFEAEQADFGQGGRAAWAPTGHWMLRQLGSIARDAPAVL